MKVIIFFLAPFLFAALARAGCSRPIISPASPLGKMIMIDPKTTEVTGIFPDVLREYGKKFGCKFEFPVMPRARAEEMMQKGEVDLLMGSIKVPERDAWGGEYVPLFVAEWQLMSIRTDALPTTVVELADKPGIKLYVVRGFNNGPEYKAMLTLMEKRGKLEYMKDPESIARMMQQGRADYTFMPYLTFIGALDTEGLAKTIGAKTRHIALKDLPTTISGAYLSKNLSKKDKVVLTELLAKVRKDNQIVSRLQKLFGGHEMIGTYQLK